MEEKSQAWWVAHRGWDVLGRGIFKWFFDRFCKKSTPLLAVVLQVPNAVVSKILRFCGLEAGFWGNPFAQTSFSWFLRPS